MRMPRCVYLVACMASVVFAVPALDFAQNSPAPGRGEPPSLGSPADKGPKPPGKVDVEPLARDSAIQERLTRILTATGWFEKPQVEVRDGVVFLSGTTQTAEYRRWAEDLASNTQDVAATVNHIDIRQSS